MKRSGSLASIITIVFTFLFTPTAIATPILLEVGKYAAVELAGYAVKSGLEALSGADDKTYYHLEESHDHFVLDFFSGFDRSLTNVALSFDNHWNFQLAINAHNASTIDSISFRGSSYHKQNTIHDHPVKGDTVNFGYDSPTGNELRLTPDDPDQYSFPAISTGRHKVSGSVISYEHPILPVSHENHKDIFGSARFLLYTDTLADGTPDDDILAWSFHLEAKHTVSEPPIYLLFISALLMLLAKSRRLAFKQ